MYDALEHCEVDSEEEFELYKEMVAICEDGIKNFRDDLEDDGTRGFIPLELDHYAAPMDNLSRIYMKRGEHDKALHLLEQVMPMYRILKYSKRSIPIRDVMLLRLWQNAWINWVGIIWPSFVNMN